MIGVRNPQGMALSKGGELLISNHGAKGGDFIGELRLALTMDGMK